MTTILKTLVGSRAHGLSTLESDYDWREVFVRPTEELLRVDQPTEKALGDDALTAWEVGHVLRLAMKCNPTILEVLAGQSEYETWFEGLPLLELFPAFLSKKRIFDAFHGYAHQQRHKLEMAKLDAGESEAKETRRRKALAARLRILYTGAELLRTGTMTVRIVDVPVIGEQVKRAKFGDMTNEEGAVIADALKVNLDAAYAESRLPMEPEIGVVNKFLVGLRVKHLHEEEKLYTPVETLKISGEALNALINNNVGCIEEAAQIGLRWLPKIVGEEYFDEIERALLAQYESKFTTTSPA